MASKQLIDRMNTQIKNEWESEFLYMAIAAWCFNNNYDGFGIWFMKQASEEREHGMKFFRYLHDIDADVTIPSITVPDVKLAGVEQCFAEGLKHEQQVTRWIGELIEMAQAEKDHGTVEFLQWFIKEQVEEEASFRDVVAKLERIKGAPGGLFMLEAKLAERA